MFKKNIFLLLAATVAFLSHAAEKKTGKIKLLTPPSIMVNIDKERPRVTPTGEFSSLPVSAKEKLKAPASSAAALLTERDKQFTWHPSPQLSSTIRTADLTGAALSEDGSLAVITERIGGEDKPNSTRVVLFNIPDQRIADGFLLKELLIDSVAFIPGSKSEMIGIRRSSAYFETRSALVRISLKNKAVMDYTEVPKGEFVSFAFGENSKIFACVASSREILVFNSENLSKASQKIKSRLSSPLLIYTGKNLIAYGREGVEIFTCENAQWNSRNGFFKAPSKFAPVTVTLIDPEIPALCFTGKFEEDCWYFRKNTFKKLKERISGVQTWDSNRKIFFAELAANAKIASFQMPQGTENPKTASPNRLKPATRNHSFALLRVPSFKDKMLQIDTRGNLFILDYSKMIRWKKSTVCIADSSGFRK